MLQGPRSAPGSSGKRISSAVTGILDHFEIIDHFDPFAPRFDLAASGTSVTCKETPYDLVARCLRADLWVAIGLWEEAPAQARLLALPLIGGLHVPQNLLASRCFKLETRPNSSKFDIYKMQNSENESNTFENSPGSRCDRLGRKEVAAQTVPHELAPVFKLLQDALSML